MAMFLAEITFLLELALFALGLVLWQRGRETGGGLSRVAGGVLVGGAVLTALCTGYFSVRYQVVGDFDRAWPMSAAPAACPAQAAMGTAGTLGMGHPGMPMHARGMGMPSPAMGMHHPRQAPTGTGMAQPARDPMGMRPGAMQHHGAGARPGGAQMHPTPGGTRAVPATPADTASKGTPRGEG